MEKTELNETIKFMRTFPVVDGHCDSVLKSLEDEKYLTYLKKDRHVDAPRIKKGGLSALFFACWVHPERANESYVEDTYELLDELHSICAFKKNPFRMATSTSDIREHRKRENISIIPCVEGGHAIKNNLRHLRNYARLGVKYMTLTWMNNNEWADGSGDEPSHDGLTERGKTIIHEMNRLGIIVDVSHTSENTFFDAVETSEKPVIASHSCCRSICNHHRNLTDEQFKALSENGGVAGICFYPGYLDETYRNELKAYEQETNSDEWIGQLPEDRRPEVGVEDILRHVTHAVDIAGVDHVALGSDFDGVAALPNGIQDCSDYPKIVNGLLEQGFSKSDVRKITGENFLRVLDESEQTST